METIKKEHQLIISVSPHIKSEETTSRIMWSVSASLLPATIMAAYFFGPRAVFTIALCIISAVLSEYLFQRLSFHNAATKPGTVNISNRLTKMIATEPTVKISRFWFIDTKSWSALAVVAPPDIASATPPIKSAAAATQAASTAIGTSLFCHHWRSYSSSLPV